MTRKNFVLQRMREEGYITSEEEEKRQRKNRNCQSA